MYIVLFLGLQQDYISCHLWLWILRPCHSNLRPQDPLLEPGACTVSFPLSLYLSLSLSLSLSFFLFLTLTLMSLIDIWIVTFGIYGAMAIVLGIGMNMFVN